MSVNQTDHRSDEFESFENLLDQADEKTPPRVKRNGGPPGKRKSSVRRREDDDDEGEMDMDLEDSAYSSFIVSLANILICYV